MNGKGKTNDSYHDIKWEHIKINFIYRIALEYEFREKNPWEKKGKFYLKPNCRRPSFESNRVNLALKRRRCIHTTTKLKQEVRKPKSPSYPNLPQSGNILYGLPYFRSEFSLLHSAQNFQASYMDINIFSCSFKISYGE